MTKSRLPLNVYSRKKRPERLGDTYGDKLKNILAKDRVDGHHCRKEYEIDGWERNNRPGFWAEKNGDVH